MNSVKPRYVLKYEVKVQFLHYLRHLLRETTYLPDPAARSWHHAQILKQYRKYRPKKQETIPPPRWGIAEKRVRDEEHEGKLLNDCRTKLMWLYRAGSGDRKALTAVLMQTYGRTGPRKHQLLKPLLQPDIPRDGRALEEALKANCSTQLDEKSLKLQLPRTLEMLVKSQNKQKQSPLSGSDANLTRFLRPFLPAQNIWGRPMPRKRIANKQKQFMLQLKEKLLPPLDDAEFHRLQDLASGVLPCPAIPKRRTRLARLPELPKLQENVKLQARTMQGLWKVVLPLCPTIKLNPNSGHSVVTWGRQTPGQTENVSSEDMLLFADLSAMKQNYVNRTVEVA